MLIDEVDRADPEFEAFLLEVLAERQVTIPELGTVRAKAAPLFVLTSNGTREMTDALRRRCLHAFVDYPPPSREQAIIELRVPGRRQGARGAARGVRPEGARDRPAQGALDRRDASTGRAALVLLGRERARHGARPVDPRRHPQARGGPREGRGEARHASSGCRSRSAVDVPQVGHSVTRPPRAAGRSRGSARLGLRAPRARSAAAGARSARARRAGPRSRCRRARRASRRPR